MTAADDATEAASPSLPPLRRNRDYVVLTTGQVIEAIGSGMTGLALLLLAYDVTGSAAQAGIVSAGFGLGQLLMGLPAGAYVDRWDRKKTLIVTALLLTVVMSTIPLAGLLWQVTFPHLLVVGVADGLIAAFIWPAGRAAMKALVPPAQLGQAATVAQARMGVGALVGPAVAGALFAVSRTLPFVVNSALMLLAALGYRFIGKHLPAPERSPDEPPSNLVRDVHEGLRWVWRTAPVRDMVGVGMLLNLAANGIITVAILGLQRDGVPPQALGAVESAAGAAGIVGALVASVVLKRVSVGWAAVAVVWLDVAMLSLMPLSSSPWWVGGILCACVLTMPTINAGMGAFMMHLTPDAMQGRSGSASSFVSMAMMPLATGAAGFLLEHLGRTWAILSYVAVLALAGVLVALSRNIRTIPRTDRFDEVPEAT